MSEPIPEREVFAAAAVLPAAERDAYLDVACAGRPGVRARVDQWLRANDADSFMEAGPGLVRPSEAETEITGMKPERAGEQIGPYKLMEQIGEGGFGTVWVADQERPVRRRVALKIIKPGMDTKEVIARFEQERQALAMMDHPHIARVLDAGTTQWGRPYFVMELVRGIKITDYCDKANLPTADRLALFIQVCNAVQHAHQKGIIHRDLKPSNILVTLHDGVPVPKVIDFGVAKATQQQRLTDLTIYTQFQQMIGTPLYMSPEQAEMSGLDIDTRSDIYSLGVLLYELLTGRTPFDPGEMMKAGLDEIRRLIREQEPPSPSLFVSSMSADQRTSVAQRRQADGARLIVQIRGDLDWIVMKALEKDRTRRYETANGLALDIGRHLASEPVLARPSSQLYRFRRMVRRNKLAFTAGALVSLALLLTVIVLAASRARITRERNEKDVALEQRNAALTDAKEQLFSALLNSARAGRFSRQPGQRLDSLDALAKAAAIRPDERLRDEAIAAMTLPDVRPGPSWNGLRPEYVDGECRLSVTWDRKDAKVLILHSIPDGRELRRIETGRLTRDMTLSRDGRFVAQQDVDSKLHIWRVSDGQVVLGDGLGKCMCWCFSPDCRRLAVSQFDSIRVMDLTTGRETDRYKTSATPWSLAFHPTDPRIAVGYFHGTTVSVYDTSDGTLVADLMVGKMDEQVVAWHPDGIRLAVGGSDPRIQIWDVPAKRKVATMEGHGQQVTQLGFHPGGSLLVSNSWDATVRMWESSSGRPVLQFSHPLSSLDFSTDGRWVGAFATEKGGQLLEVAACPEYRTMVSSLGLEQRGFFDGDISPDGRLLAMGMHEGVTIWEIATGREAAFLPIRKTPSAFFQPDGRELITCGDAGLHRWSIPDRTGTDGALALGAPQKIPLPFPIPTRACRSRDGRLIAVTSEDADGAVVVDAATGEPQTPLFNHNRAGFVAISPDGNWLTTAGWQSQRLRLWNVSTGKMAHEWNPGALSIGFTPDSRELAWMQREECGFWSVETFQPVRRLPRNTSAYPTPAAFSPDEKLVAVETTPGVIHLTELVTGRLVAKLTDPFGDRATWMSFTPDGTQLVTASVYDKTIHVWDLRRIRALLKTMKLDWQWPDFPAADPERRDQMLTPRVETLPLPGKVNGPDLSGALNTMKAMANAFIAGRTEAQTERLLSEALTAARVSAAENPSQLEARVQDMAELRYRQKQYAAAEALYRERIESRRRRDGGEVSDVVLGTRASLGRLLSEWAWAERATAGAAAHERAREGEKLLRETLAAREENAEYPLWRMADLQSRLGGALCVTAFTDPTLTAATREPKLLEVETLLQEAHKGMTQDEKVEQKYLRDGIERFIRLYEAWEKPVKLAEWKRKLEVFDKAALEMKSPVPATGDAK